jgi:hypothetical protein
MNDGIKDADQPRPVRQPYHVFLGDGQAVPVEAAGFEHEVNAEERIIFLVEDGKPIKEIFCPATAVALIVPDSALARSHSFIALQTQVKNLSERIDRIETALAASHPPSGE